MVVALVALALLVPLVLYVGVGAVRSSGPVAAPSPSPAASSPVALSPAPAPVGTGALRETSDGAPRDVVLDDKGATITLTWTDTTAGTVQFAVVGGPRGVEPKLQKVLTPGTTTLTLQGANTTVDYCFVVMAIVDAQTFARAPQVCTHR
jgi:hypothetical protein